ncbi:MAG: type IX secretion system protein PorQ [Bacteroidales bacterium]|nr:type IX secretion system protein PorQ [Bacteroidales bacterium]
MRKKYLYISILLLFPILSYSQVGGKYTYEFLNLTNSARSASLGGIIVSSPDNDPNLPFHNPSILNPQMDNNIVLNYVSYFSDINFGYFSYAKNFKNIGNFAAGIHYINYGNFTSADPTGTITGEFSASEYAFNLIYSRSLPFDSLFNIGINLKPIISNFERYSSFGLAADIGINFTNKKKLFSAGLVFKNIGFQLKPYYTGSSEPLPFEIQAGIYQKLKHAPFQFMMTIRHLERFKLAPVTENKENYTGEPEYDSDKPKSDFEKFGDNLMRHFIFGIEINPFKPVFLRLGYNYQRRQELKLSSYGGMVGFSWGFGIQLSKFQLSYGHATYHLAGASNHFSLAVNLNEFFNKVQ